MKAMEVTFNNLPQAISSLLEEISSLKTILSAQNKNSESNPQERLTRKEIKDQYKVCYATIHNLMKNGSLPYVKVGRKTLFKREDVESLFTNKTPISDSTTKTRRSYSK
jgi:excisionase family DNA binding protein